jgi:hypothetical protein
MMTCQDLPTELPTAFIPSVKSVGKSVGKLIYTVYHVNYKGNHRRKKSVGIFQRAPEKNHRRIEKSSVLFGGFLKKFN